MLRIQRMVGATPARARTRGPLSLGSAFGALLALTLLGATALASPAVQDSDELRAIRARLDEVQAHLDHLRAMLDHALAGETEEPAEGGTHHGTVEVHGHGAHGSDDAREHEEDVHVIDLGNAVRGELGQRLHERLDGKGIHVITVPGADGKTLTIDGELELDADVLELDGETLRIGSRTFEVRGLGGKTLRVHGLPGDGKVLRVGPGGDDDEHRFHFESDDGEGRFVFELHRADGEPRRIELHRSGDAAPKVHVLRGLHDHLLEVLDGIGVSPHGEHEPDAEGRHDVHHEHVRKLHDHLIERILGDGEPGKRRVDLQWVIQELHGDDADDEGPKHRLQVHGVDLGDLHEHLRRAIRLDGGDRRIEIRGPRIEIRVDGDVEGLHERLREALKGINIRIERSSDGGEHEEASQDAPRGEARTRRLV